jgi:ATP-dependent Lon protease
VEVEYPHQPTEPTDEVKAYGMALINAIKELLPLNPLYSEELKNYLNRFSPNDPSPLTDFAAALTSATGNELQEVLDCVPMLKRMEKVLPMLRKEVEVARLQKKSPPRSTARSASTSASSSSRNSSRSSSRNWA